MSANTSHIESLGCKLKIRYGDSSDEADHGLGLDSFPLLYEALGTKNLLDWGMSLSEKVALLFLLEGLKPQAAIEIGTQNGGSLQVLAKFSNQVYSIDIDPSVANRLRGKFPNVEFLTGPSDQILPPLIQRLQKQGTELSFILIDGDHSAEGVRTDIDNILKFQPTVPLYILMHDSFNPQCRRGMAQAKWEDSPFVHAVELDFVLGFVSSARAFDGQLWSGLALGILLPYERRGRFEITAMGQRTFEAADAVTWQLLLKQSVTLAKRSLPGRAASRAKRYLFG